MATLENKKRYYLCMPKAGSKKKPRFFAITGPFKAKHRVGCDVVLGSWDSPMEFALIKKAVEGRGKIPLKVKVFSSR